MPRHDRLERNRVTAALRTWPILAVPSAQQQFPDQTNPETVGRPFLPDRFACELLPVLCALRCTATTRSVHTTFSDFLVENADSLRASLAGERRAKPIDFLTKSIQPEIELGQRSDHIEGHPERFGFASDLVV